MFEYLIYADFCLKNMWVSYKNNGFFEDVKLIKILIVSFPKRYLCFD